MKPLKIAFVFLLSGCVTAPIALTPMGAAVKAGKMDPDAGMQEIGPITAIDGNGCGGFGALGNYENAYKKLKNMGAEMGATFVQIINIEEPSSKGDCFDNRFQINGIAYK